MAHDYPRRGRFAGLTAREEGLGLLSVGRSIGTRADWHAVLRERAVAVRGHRVVRAKTPTATPVPSRIEENA